MGTTLEFKRPGTFPPHTDIIGSGPFRLEPGQWTDDTSMALCLAESLLACRGNNLEDQCERYLRWQRNGENSVTGHCFDIGNTVSAALRKYASTGCALAGSTDPMSAGNGSIMRLASVILYYGGSELAEVAKEAERTSRTTHQAPEALWSCRVLATLIWTAIRSAQTKEEVLASLKNLKNERTIPPRIREIVSGSSHEKTPPEIRGTGYVANSLEAALWAFFHA